MSIKVELKYPGESTWRLEREYKTVNNASLGVAVKRYKTALKRLNSHFGSRHAHGVRLTIGDVPVSPFYAEIVASELLLNDGELTSERIESCFPDDNN